MVRDLVGNDIKVGDMLFVNGVVYTVKKIEDSHIIGGNVTGSKLQQVMIPGKLICEAEFPFDPNKQINGFVVKQPSQDILGTQA